VEAGAEDDRVDLALDAVAGRRRGAATSRCRPVTSSTLGLPSAGYQRFDGRMRLQPIV
jgi:hypothetical protein